MWGRLRRVGACRRNAATHCAAATLHEHGHWPASRILLLNGTCLTTLPDPPPHLLLLLVQLAARLRCVSRCGTLFLRPAAPAPAFQLNKCRQPCTAPDGGRRQQQCVSDQATCRGLLCDTAYVSPS